MIDAKNIPHTISSETQEQWTLLINILRYLRSKDGCPWDQEQTVASLRPHIIEEASELLDAIAQNLDNPSDTTETLVAEEMGDVLLVITMMMVLHEVEQNSSLAMIIKALNEKLIRRHPHVFDNVTVENSAQLATQWQNIKKKEGKKDPPLSQHKNYMHVLERTKEIQKKLYKTKQQFAEPLEEKVASLTKVIQSFTELQKQMPESAYTPIPTDIEKTVGDALFLLVDISRTLKVSPTSALSRRLSSEIQQHSQDTE